MTRVTDWKRE